jgi:hypothetical protein
MQQQQLLQKKYMAQDATNQKLIVQNMPCGPAADSSVAEL